MHWNSILQARFPHCLYVSNFETSHLATSIGKSIDNPTMLATPQIIFVKSF
jgi:hypothetical protein